MPQKLLKEKHIAYIQSLGKNTNELAYHLSAHLRLNAVYWGLTALYILGAQNALDREEIIDFVMSCWDEEVGGFGAHPAHDAHILPTTSAVQIMVMQGAEERLDKDRITDFILSLQNPTGSFKGDKWGETDTRFAYCAINTLSLLGTMHIERTGKRCFDVEKTVDYFKRCRNYDGGFGSDEGGESHAAQVFTCVAALAILDRLEEVISSSGDENDMLGWWLAERQLPNGGLNGRPEKLEDVCYSFWVLSSLSILRKLHWIDSDKLVEFILSAQDDSEIESGHGHPGGIADRPGDVSDVFHTLFGLAGLSLLGYEGLQDIDPVYCMPAKLIERKGLKKGWIALPRKTGSASATRSSS